MLCNGMYGMSCYVMLCMVWYVMLCDGMYGIYVYNVM